MNPIDTIFTPQNTSWPSSREEPIEESKGLSDSDDKMGRSLDRGFAPRRAAIAEKKIAKLMSLNQQQVEPFANKAESGIQRLMDSRMIVRRITASNNVDNLIKSLDTPMLKIHMLEKPPLPDVLQQKKHGLENSKDIHINEVDNAAQHLHLDNPHADHSDSDHDLGGYIDELAIGEAAHKVEHRMGKPAGRAVELVGGLTRNLGASSTHPWRDRVVSSGVHLAILETIGLVVKRVPAYKVVVVANVVADGAKQIQKEVESSLVSHPIGECWTLTNVREAADCFDRFHVTNGAKTLAQIAQIPAAVVHSVHHEITHEITESFNRLEQCEENMRQSLEPVGDHPSTVSDDFN